MSATSDAILAAVLKAAETWAASPQGQATLRKVEDMIIQNLPGWEGEVIRDAGAFLHALQPHEVESIGFSRTGRDGGG